MNCSSLGNWPSGFSSDYKAGHLAFAVLQSSSKSYFQTSLTIKISFFWARTDEITYHQSNAPNCHGCLSANFLAHWKSARELCASCVSENPTIPWPRWFDLLKHSWHTVPLQIIKRQESWHTGTHDSVLCPLLHLQGTKLEIQKMAFFNIENY